MAALYAICDCDNCFVSCERVFRPDLEGRPVVVLSNNDGCVVARSREARMLGIRMGIPFAQMRAQWGEDRVTAFSSNYELYADMTGRVMSLIQRNAPAFFRYSIDEAFCMLPPHNADEVKRWGEELARMVKRATGMPLSVGIAPTKTLAKVAVHFAKNYPGYKKCCVITTEAQREKALSLTEIGDVWGIGRRLSSSLNGRGVATALEFAHKSEEWVRARYNIVVHRTWRELNGLDTIPDEEVAANKSIMTSRSFPKLVYDYKTLRTLVANFASRSAEKLRRQGSVAAIVGVFVVTNRFREDLPQYGKMLDYTLATPTDSTLDIVAAAGKVLKMIYREGFGYKKAGVMLMGISGREAIQPDLFEYSPEKADKLHRLDTAVDRINRVWGRDTVVTATQHLSFPSGADGVKEATPFADIIRHDHRSPSPTTRWTDIIQLK